MVATLQIGEWLGELKLEQYTQLFVDNGIDLEVLRDLTDLDLEKLGVLVGHRRKLLRAITEQSRAAPGRPSGQQASAFHPAERRQLTVMFCDLVGSTRLSNMMDPEDYGDLIRDYRRTCSEVIQTCGGTVARFVGDGILAYFGYPRAHEDDPSRACRSGLGIIESLARQKEVPAPLQVRIACATGLVMVGDLIGEGAAEANGVVGATPNLSARLQSIASPNALVISDSTQVLLGESFRCRNLGVRDFQGIPGPVRVWQVLSERKFESRFAARVRGAPPPFVGRQRELGVLIDRWQAARSGSGATVLLTGEPGIGKSRLVHELREQLVSEPCRMVLYQCFADHSSSVLYPVIAQIEQAATIGPRDVPEQKLAKLEQLFGDQAGGDLLVPHLAALMGIVDPDQYPTLPVAPQERKFQLLSMLGDRLAQVAQRSPLLLVIEDIHWIDPSTRELLDLTISRLSKMAVLIVMTARYEIAGLQPPGMTHFSLARLDDAESTQLVQALTAGNALTEEILQAIKARTEGVPLFIEELTKAVIGARPTTTQGGQHPSAPPPGAAIPATLRDSLMARIDSLKSSKAVAQLASVLGRTFSYELLRQVFVGAEHRLREALLELVQAELLVVNDLPSGANYAFRHALIQEAAYDSLLRQKRWSLHGHVAAVLKSKFRSLIDGQPEALAHHLTLGGQHLDAARQWQRAGTIAVQRSANQEAVVHFQNALAALEQLPPEQGDRAQELDILVRLSGALRATRGYAAADIGQLCRRALALARQLGDRAGELQAISGLYSFHLLRSEYVAAEQAARDLLEVAVGAEQRTSTMVAHRGLGVVSFYFGRLKLAEQHLQRALDLYDKDSDRGLAILYGADHAEQCACFLSQTKWVLGAQRDAIALQSWAIEHAQSLQHAHSIAQALAYRSFLFCLARDIERIEADGKEALKIAGEYRLKLMESFAHCTLAIASTLRQPTTARAGMLDEAIDRLHTIAPNALRPLLLSIAADMHGKLGAIERGLGLTDEANEVMDTTAERWAEAEVLRVRASLLVAGGRHDDAESCLRAAVRIAEQQSAASWIVRSADDLAHILGNTDRAAEAQQVRDSARAWTAVVPEN
jgi:predicted ATPase/class 3 adenylate cyclase